MKNYLKYLLNGGQTGQNTHVIQKGDNLSSLAARYNTNVDNLMRINGITNANEIYVGDTINLGSPTPQTVNNEIIYSENGRTYWPNYDTSKFTGAGGQYLQYGYNNLRHSGNKITFEELVDTNGWVQDPGDLQRRVAAALANTPLTKAQQAAVYGNIAHETMGFKKLTQLGTGPGVGLFMQEKGTDSANRYDTFITKFGFGTGDYVQDQINSVVYEMYRSGNIKDPVQRYASTRDTRNKRTGYTDDIAFGDWASDDFKLATKAFMELYERPDPDRAHLEERLRYADYYMTNYKDGGRFNYFSYFKKGGSVNKKQTSTLYNKYLSVNYSKSKGNKNQTEYFRQRLKEVGYSNEEVEEMMTTMSGDQVRKILAKDRIKKHAFGGIFNPNKKSNKFLKRSFDLDLIEGIDRPNKIEEPNQNTSSLFRSASKKDKWDIIFKELEIANPSSTTSPSGLDASLVDFSRLDSKDLGKGYVLTCDLHGKCTSGPGTWLKTMGYNVDDYGGWWTTPYSNNTTMANFVLNDPDHWEVVYTSKGNQASQFTDLRPGDIALSFANKSNGTPTSHAQMWTGKDWRSDGIQKGAWVYNNPGRLGDGSFVVVRYKS